MESIEEEEVTPVEEIPAGFNQLQEYVSKMIQVSMEYKNSIDTAKTTTKKNYFKKKLIKNNKLVYRAVTMLEYLKVAQAQNQTVESTVELQPE